MGSSRPKARQRRLADRFRDAAANCPSIFELHGLLSAAASELGFSYFALLHHASLRHPDRHYIRIDNYPAAWAAELVESGLYLHDPVHLATRKANAAFRWRDLERLGAMGRWQQAILRRSRDHGLGEGVTIPVNVPGEPRGSCSFAMSRGEAIPERQFLCAESIGLHAFEAARRLTWRASIPQRPHLSRREIQCLRLVALGKTDGEIATILGIAVETARQYVKRARQSYDVVSRTQLVVLGLRDDWIDFDDLGVIPD